MGAKSYILLYITQVLKSSDILVNLVLTVGIEPTSTVLQTAAMTTSAKSAVLVDSVGIEPTTYSL